jgi:thiamine pyrophosphokinase
MEPIKEQRKDSRPCLIVSGGETDPWQLKTEYEKLRRQGGLLVAADRGLEALRQLQEIPCIPDLAVGDFDSVSPDTLGYFQKIDGIRWEKHRPEKDESDTELAVTLAAGEGCKELLLMGVTGTRLDHVLSNIHLLADARRQGLTCTILDGHNRIRLTGEPMTFRREESPYPFVSFIPLSEEVTHMKLTGFKYNLEDYHMVLGVECGHCVSNEIVEQEAHLSFEKGLLLVIESKD